MKEIEQNKQAWNILAKDHYERFKHALLEHPSLLNDQIQAELGPLENKTLIHLQCNTGADTISLARSSMKWVTGVDLSDESINYAQKLKEEFHIQNIDFIASDILALPQVHAQTYDIVFTSEGVLGWIPDLKQWARVIASLLKEEGFFYVYDTHPFLLMWDFNQLTQKRFDIRYRYFGGEPDVVTTIGGYASETKTALNYWWNHPLSDVINALLTANLEIEFVHEFDTLFYDLGGMKQVGFGLFQYPELKDRFPMSFSIKAKKKKPF